LAGAGNRLKILSKKGGSNIIHQFNKENYIMNDMSMDISASANMNIRFSFDESTATYSCAAFSDIVNRFLSSQRTQGMLLIDLDDIKFISRVKTKAVSEAVVALIVRNIYNNIPNNAIVGRLKEDTFAVFLPDLQYEGELESIAKKLILAHREPVSYNKENYICTLTIGGVQTSKVKIDDLSAESLIEHAEISQNKARQNGKNQYIELEPEYLEIVNRKAYVLTLLKETLYNKSFRLNFQPFFNMRTGRLIGFETLCRMKDPKGGYIMPDEFIKIAEENNVIFDVDFAVLEYVCKLLYRQKNIDFKGIISVNISSITFVNPMFIPTINNILLKYSTPRNCLAIELTETAFLESYTKAKANIISLNNLGIKILLDDFGSGYNSLKSVLDLNVNILKIDKSLIDNIHEMQSSFIVEKTIEIAKLLKMDIVAEGIETRTQFETLKQMDIKAGQGFYLGRPLSEKQFVYHLNRKDDFDEYL
jgi:EAL domain-containing protein (putative c-di-GMP-specific phosphodiesterase class I)/GGDEF domain-containing protein